jgi:hypothetical protein
MSTSFIASLVTAATRATAATSYAFALLFSLGKIDNNCGDNTGKQQADEN